MYIYRALIPSFPTTGVLGFWGFGWRSGLEASGFCC